MFTDACHPQHAYAHAQVRANADEGKASELVGLLRSWSRTSFLQHTVPRLIRTVSGSVPQNDAPPQTDYQKACVVCMTNDRCVCLPCVCAACVLCVRACVLHIYVCVRAA